MTSMIQIKMTNASKTIIVPDDYQTIGKAIGAAKSGDTIYVRSGVYEPITIIKKSISLIGENKYTTIIRGQGTGSVVDVFYYGRVSITGFTIENGYNGIWLETGARTENKIFDNIITDNTNGINIDYSNHNYIFHNIITDNEKKAIQSFTSGNHFIARNLIENNEDGIYIMHSALKPNWIFYNRIRNNEGHGICLSSSGKNGIENNVLTGNNKGLLIGTSSDNVVKSNEITNNNMGVHLDGDVMDTVVHKNNFIDNSINAYMFRGDLEFLPNEWKNNHWSDYQGEDLNDDGVGDEPYVIEEDNIDCCPLMNPIVRANDPVPSLVWTGVPESMELGEWATITIKTSNGGGTVDWQTIHCGFPDNPPIENIEILNHDLDGGAEIYPPGTELPAAYGDHTITSEYVIVEGIDGPWEKGEIHTMIVRVKPENTGTFIFYIKTVSQAEGVTYYYPTREETITKDQQDEYVYPFSIDVQTPEPITGPKIEITISSDRDKLHGNINEAEITIKAKNVGIEEAKDVSINVEIPPNYEADEVSWPSQIQPGEEITRTFTAKIKRCIEESFKITGTYKDADGNTIDIPLKSYTIDVGDIILLEISEEPPYMDVSISKEKVQMCKGWEGLGAAEDVASAIFATKLLELEGIDIDEITPETILEHADKIYDFIEYLRDMENIDFDEKMLADWSVGVVINTVKIWILSNTPGNTEDDGTMTYRAIWPLEVLSWLLEEVYIDNIDVFLQTFEENIGKIPDIPMHRGVIYIEDPMGKLYLNVTDPENIPVYEVGDMAFAMLDSQTLNFTCTVNATEAHHDEEEYILGYLGIRDNEVTENWSKPYNITKEKIQEFTFELNDDGSVKNIIEAEEPDQLSDDTEDGTAISTEIRNIGIAVSVVVAVAAVLLIRKRRNKTK